MNNNNLSDIIKLENTINKMLEEIKQNIFKEVNNAKFDNVNSISKNISVIKLSNLINNVWNPECYIASAQAEIIAKKFENITTTKQMINTINDIIKNKYIVINNNKYPLNPVIINILLKYKREN